MSMALIWRVFGIPTVLAAISVLLWRKLNRAETTAKLVIQGAAIDRDEKPRSFRNLMIVWRGVAVFAGVCALGVAVGQLIRLTNGH